MNDTVETTAQRIAERGREALVGRLRPAFEEAASAHADVLELEPDQLEQMVQRAADNADGLQWRRALASVASEELGIGLGEALSHPAVERAQELLGAPSYEESLAALGAAPPVSQETVDEGREQPAPADRSGRTAGETDDAAPVVAAVPVAAPATERSEPDDGATPEAGAEREGAPAPANAQETGPDEPPRTVRLPAVHLGGIANLPSSAADIQLRFSVAGIDVMRGRNRTLGRLSWPEVKELEIPESRGRLRRRKPGGSHLVLRTEHGDATFEIPSLSPDELRDRLAPLRRYISGTSAG